MHEAQPITEAMAISAGHPQLTGAELEALLLDHTVHGVYRGGFHFIAYVGNDCRMEGRNHVGSHNFGVCQIDEEAHTFTVTWDNGWEHTTTRAYRVGDEVRFYDADSGALRNTFSGFQEGRHALDIWS
ncbi:MAG: hypothetical protein JRH11_26255 [Deltaproteobacteria bacterium]|nr:hypothetical protein [Deltaproteobacteria bacterium]